MIKIAIDAMGGDNAPKITVEGAMLAIKDFLISGLFYMVMKIKLNHS